MTLSPRTTTVILLFLSTLYISCVVRVMLHNFNITIRDKTTRISKSLNCKYFHGVLKTVGTLRSNDATAMPERRLKSEFAFFQSISQLFPPTYFVKCRRTLLELNSWAPYPNTVREIKFVRCLFTSSIKREIRHVHVVVVQKRAEKCTKKHGARAKLLFC